MRGKKRHTEAEIRSKMSESICGRIAAGENYNLTRDSESLQLKVIGAKADIKWSSNNEEIATVDDTGVVTAKKAGMTIIYAKVYGKTLKCKIEVSAVHDG